MFTILFGILTLFCFGIAGLYAASRKEELLNQSVNVGLFCFTIFLISLYFELFK